MVADRTLEQDLEANGDASLRAGQSAEPMARSSTPPKTSAKNALVRPSEGGRDRIGRISWIGERVSLVMGAYRRADYEQPNVFHRTAVAVLCEFPDTVIEKVTDPTVGIQTSAAFPPSIAEIKARAVNCERSLRTIEMGKARERAATKAASAPQDKPVNRNARPSYEELQERYSYWLGPDNAQRLRETDAPWVKRKTTFRSLAEIAAECGVSQEQIDAMPDAKLRSAI